MAEKHFKICSIRIKATRVKQHSALLVSSPLQIWPAVWTGDEINRELVWYKITAIYTDIKYMSCLFEVINKYCISKQIS